MPVVLTDIALDCMQNPDDNRVHLESPRGAQGAQGRGLDAGQTQRESPSFHTSNEIGDGHVAGHEGTDIPVVIEKGPTSFGATVPDLPGCFAVADSREEVERLIQEAIEEHVALLRADGLTVPEPSSSVAEVEVKLSKG